MTFRSFAVAVSLVVAIIGVILLSTTVYATTPSDTEVSCGTGFQTDTKAAGLQHFGNLVTSLRQGYWAADPEAGYSKACDDALATRRTFGFGLLGLGVVAFIGSVAVRPARRPVEPKA